MFHNYLAEEEIKERVRQRMQEAETYSLQKRLGYGDSGNARWLLVTVFVVAVVMVGYLL